MKKILKGKLVIKNNINVEIKKLQQDENFWKHEWEKHGSCMFKDIDEFHYFNTALNLFHFALQKKLPDKWYHPETGKCLIPVDLNFQFIDS